MTIAALVLGIIALFIAFIPFIGIAAFIPAAIGGLLGLIGSLRKRPRRGIAVAGLILSVMAGIMAGLNLKATDAAVTALDEAANGRERHELELNGVYFESYAGDDYYLLLDIQNVSEKPVAGFRGYVAFYDEFDKLCHKEDIECLQAISPGQHLYLGKLVADGQSQIEVLPRLATPSTGSAQIEKLRISRKTKLFCRNIAY